MLLFETVSAMFL